MANTKRYTATITVYLYSEQEDEADRQHEVFAKAKAITEKLNKKDDGLSAEVEALHEADFGTLGGAPIYLEPLRNMYNLSCLSDGL